MKRQLAVFAASALIFASCQKATTNEEMTPAEAAVTETNRCASQEVLEAQLAADPTLRQRMDQIERFIQQYTSNPARMLEDGTVEISVVFNVLYKTNAQNISDAQLNSQIDVLNEDFATTNADYGNTPTEFSSVRSGNTKIRFVRDGITVRKKSNKTQWSTNDAMKKSALGGINPTSPTTKLNIWVCNMGGGILGYAQFPGGNSATDGIVLDDAATGRVGSAVNNYPYHLGRTATHEIGHWLNLRHIWGDATCGNDQVGDTPVHTSSNGGCPAYPKNSTCGGTTHAMMTMNYMDYTNDACMFMFTLGQKDRMRATFATGGGRNSFAQP